MATGTEDVGDDVGVVHEDLVTTTLTYRANNQILINDYPACGTNKSLRVVEPDAPGPYPVFLFMTGSWAPFNATSSRTIVEEAARQGFVAAEIQYQNGTLPYACESGSGTGPGWYKARCAFSPAYNSQSAISVICARPKADCAGRGIVVAGHSQGAGMAMLARNFDTRVRGVWAMGMSDVAWDGTHQACMDQGTGPLGQASVRLQRNERVRITRGLNEPWDYVSHNRTTGRSCLSTATNCLVGPNGSGWYRTPNSELYTTLNPNEHCFMQNNPLDGSGNRVDCGNNHVVDPVFRALPPSATYESGMYQNIAWLRNTILPLGNQP